MRVNAKNRTWGIISSILIMVLIITGQANPQSAKERSVRYALYVAITEVVKQFDNKINQEIDLVIENSEGYILNDPLKHQKIENSKKLVNGYVYDQVEKYFDEQLKVIYQSFQSDALGLTEEDYVTEVKARFQQQIDGKFSNFMDDEFQDIFSQAREYAVKQQLDSLTLHSYPSQEEADRADKAGWGSEAIDSLRKVIKQEIDENNKEIISVIFEENESELENAVTMIVNDIKRQHDEQKKVLKVSVNPTAITKNQIVEELRNTVLSAIEDMTSTANKEQKIFAIFPSVKKGIDEKALETVTHRFEVFIQNFSYSFNNDAIKKVIYEDFKKHRSNNQESQIIIAQHLFPEAAEEVVNAYSDQVKTSPEYQTFQEQLKQMISEVPEVRNALKSALLGAIKGRLALVRKNIAEVQVQKHFSPVYNGEWVVPENILKKIDKEEFGVSSFEQCLDLPFINRGSASYERNALLRETENEVLSKIGKLLAEGKRAWDGQESIIKGKEEEIERELLQELDTKPEEQWVSYYTEQVEKEWGENRIIKIWRGFSEPPPNASTKYSPLFGDMEEEIKKIVHNYFEAIIKKREKEARQQEELKQQQEEEAKKQAELKQQQEEEAKKQGKKTTDSEMESNENQESGIGASGEQSVDKKEDGSGGTQLIPTEGGKLVPKLWWLLYVLIAIIIILVIAIIWLLRKIESYKEMIRQLTASQRH